MITPQLVNLTKYWKSLKVNITLNPVLFSHTLSFKITAKTARFYRAHDQSNIRKHTYARVDDEQYMLTVQVSYLLIVRVHKNDSTSPAILSGWQMQLKVLISVE